MLKGTETEETLGLFVSFFFIGDILIGGFRSPCFPLLATPMRTIPILINDILMPIVDSFRYLGVILDIKLTFFDDISNVAKKVSRSVGNISKLRHYAPTSIFFKLYYPILHPHLLYGIIVR